MADESGAPVVYLRTLDDSLALRERLTEGARIGIIGGGWIGLEVASAARQHGAEVTVLESLDLPLLRVLGPEVAQVFADLHREHGVDLRTGVQVTGITVPRRRRDGRPRRRQRPRRRPPRGRGRRRSPTPSSPRPPA